MTEPISVVLIDDHGLCRRGLSELLEQRAGIKVHGTAGTADEAVRLLASTKPDLAIMDLKMSPVDGFRLLTRLRAEGIVTPVVVLTMSDSQEDLGRAFRAGVRGYLLKDMDPDDVIDAIRRAARGEVIVSPAMAVTLPPARSGSPSSRSSRGGPSPICSSGVCSSGSRTCGSSSPSRATCCTAPPAT